MFSGVTGKDKESRCWPLNEACEMRLDELSESLTNAFATIKNDELLATMFDDPTSKGFAKQRIREIIEDCIENDREALIKHLYKQNALLQEDYTSLDEEYLKVFNEQKEMTSEFNNKINELEREKRSLEEKINSLKRKFEEREEEYENIIKEKEEELLLKIEEYEHILKEKDNKMISKTETGSKEVQSLNEKIKELEAKLRESDHNYLDLSLKNTALQSELDLQKAKNKDHEIMLQAKVGRNEEMSTTINKYEALQKDLRDAVERLTEENNQLKATVRSYEEGKKAFEEDFKKRVQEIEKGIQSERAASQDKLEKLHKKYEIKMNQYKSKILEYKSKLGDKQRELDESLKKSEESQSFQDKSVEILRHKLEEESEFSQKKLFQIEEESQKKLRETSMMYDSQLRRLESHFEDLFQQKVGQIQEEVRQLQHSLSEKTRVMDRDYIKLSEHEEAIREKNALINRLNQDMVDKEAQFNHEMSYKMKELDKKLTEEFDRKQNISERNILELENQLSELRSQKKKSETALAMLEKEKASLKQEVESLILQKRKLAEKAEEWHSKYQSLNITYEGERKRGLEMEERIKEYQHKYSELKRALEAIGGESEEKNIQTIKMAEQLAIMERELLEKEGQLNSLQSEYDNLERDYTRINEQLETLREHEAQSRTKVLDAEERVRLLSAEIQDSERRNERLRVQVETLDKQAGELSFKLNKTEASYTMTSKEKNDLEKSLTRTLAKTKKLRQNNRHIGKTVATKIAALKSSLREILSYCKGNIVKLQKESEAKIIELLKMFTSIMEKTDAKHKFEKENIKTQLQNEMSYNHECIKEKYVRLQKDLTELYEQKCIDKDRTMKHLQDMHTKSSQKNMDLEMILERLEAKYAHALDEKAQILQEKEELDQKLESQRQKFVEEINNFNSGLKKSSQEFLNQKSILQEDYQNHLDSLGNNVSELKKRHKEVLLKFANHIEELSLKHREEMEKVEIKYREALQDFEEILNESRMVEQELAKKTVSLTENLSSLERKNKDLELEVSVLKQKEDEYLDQYETKMEELKNMIEKDNARMNHFKSEKITEISQQKSVIIMLEKETALKESKIHDLAEENDELKRQLDEVLSQSGLQESRHSQIKENAFLNKETTKLRYHVPNTLSHAHSTPNLLPTRKFDKENFQSEDNSQNDLLDKNDIRFTFNQSYQGKRFEDSISPAAASRQGLRTDSKYHRRGQLSMQDFT